MEGTAIKSEESSSSAETSSTTQEQEIYSTKNKKNLEHCEQCVDINLVDKKLKSEPNMQGTSTKSEESSSSAETFSTTQELESYSTIITTNLEHHEQCVDSIVNQLQVKCEPWTYFENLASDVALLNQQRRELFVKNKACEAEQNLSFSSYQRPLSFIVSLEHYADINKEETSDFGNCAAFGRAFPRVGNHTEDGFPRTNEVYPLEPRLQMFRVNSYLPNTTGNICSTAPTCCLSYRHWSDDFVHLIYQQNISVYPGTSANISKKTSVMWSRRNTSLPGGIYECLQLSKLYFTFSKSRDKL